MVIILCYQQLLLCYCVISFTVLTRHQISLRLFFSLGVNCFPWCSRTKSVPNKLIVGKEHATSMLSSVAMHIQYQCKTNQDDLCVKMTCWINSVANTLIDGKAHATSLLLLCSNANAKSKQETTTRGDIDWRWETATCVWCGIQASSVRCCCCEGCPIRLKKSKVCCPPLPLAIESNATSNSASRVLHAMLSACTDHTWCMSMDKTPTWAKNQNTFLQADVAAVSSQRLTKSPIWLKVEFVISFSRDASSVVSLRFLSEMFNCGIM